MFCRVQTHLRNRADLLMSGQLSRLVNDYSFPLPVHLTDSRVILRTAEEAQAMLSVLRMALLARGVVALRPRVTAVDLPHRGRFRAWVDWEEQAVPGEETRVSSAIYYFQVGALGLRTEMIVYTRLSMPELNPQFAALALSA
jgi:hypothetical protein